MGEKEGSSEGKKEGEKFSMLLAVRQSPKREKTSRLGTL